MAFGSSRGFTPTPPEKGSFPLDHKAECKPAMREFLECLREHRNNHHVCKDLSKRYLACRMDRGLMAPEDLNNFGFQYEVSMDELKAEQAKENRKEKRGFYGGLSVKFPEGQPPPDTSAPPVSDQ
mmetsp:Transcript_18706/g.47344  ORF Transcript_18706/g.47344 Transcript_18706/m.47344 type:complete len:125 (+) Transcript_18706:150-524(+)